MAEYVAAIDPATYGEPVSTLDQTPEAQLEALRAFAAERRVAMESLTVSHCLIHAIEHTQEHLGQAYLTRQLWEHQNAEVRI